MTANAALPPAGQSEQKGQRMSTQWTRTYKIAFKTATDKSSETNMGISSNRCFYIHMHKGQVPPHQWRLGLSLSLKI